MLADIDQIFGMEINFHVLQIKCEFSYAPLIFCVNTALDFQ